jgi:hypothetical protein
MRGRGGYPRMQTTRRKDAEDRAAAALYSGQHQCPVLNPGATDE